ncbi:hypothetical protein A483_HHAL011757, partial [Halyomorpha halys]
MAVSPRYYP